MFLEISSTTSRQYNCDVRDEDKIRAIYLSPVATYLTLRGGCEDHVA